MPSIAQPPVAWKRYGFAVFAALVPAAAKFAFWSTSVGNEPFSFFFVAIVLSAWYGGLGPAVLCAAIGALVGNFLLGATSAGGSTTLDSVARTAIFLLEALIIGAISRSRIRAKHTVAEQNRLLEAALSGVGDCVLTTNIRGQIQSINPAAQALIGWSQAEAKGRICGSVAHFKSGQHPVADALETGKPFRSSEPLEMNLRNGSVAYVDVVVTPLNETDKGEAGALLILRDRTRQIADRRELEDALARSNEILESISNAFFHLDADWRFTYVNRPAERLLQRTRESLLGKKIWDEYDRKEADAFRREYTRVVEHRVKSRFEGFYAPLNVWLEVDAFPSRNGLSVYLSDITLRKRLEAERLLLFEQVSEERRRLETILNSLPAGVVIIDSDRKVVLASTSAQSLLGIPASYTLSPYVFDGYGAFDPRTGDDLPLRDYPLFRSLEAGATTLRHEVWIRGRGSERLLEVSVSPLRESSGQIGGAVGIYQDITAWHHTQAALAEAREDTAHILESINEGCIAFDADLIYRYLNGAAASMLNFNGPNTIGTPADNLFEAERSSWLDTMRDVARGTSARHLELFYRPLARWFEGSLYPTRGGGVILFFTDVTAARETREALLCSEHRYRSLVTATSQIVWITGPTGLFSEPQLSWSEFTGQPWPEHAGSGSAEMIHPDDRACVKHEWAQGIVSGQSMQMAYRLWHAASETYHACLSRAVPLRDSSGEIREWIGTITDVEEQRRLQEKLLHTAKLESLGVLAGGVAHDFNNILTGILGSASFLLEELEPQSSLLPIAQTLYKASERAAQLTRQMLAYSGRGRFVLEVVDISRQVKSSSDLVRAALPRNVDLAWLLATEPIWVQVDLAQFQQVVMNLVINGAEAIAAPQGTVTIATRREVIGERRETLSGDMEAGEYALLVVRDTGTGMDDDTRRKIFDPFFTTKFTGRGLGLAATLGIVRAHQGGIEVDTAPGKGTEFRVYFPVSEVVLEIRSDTSETPNEADSQRGALLLVDDEPVVIETAKELLKAQDWTVLTANNGWEALEILSRERERISLLLLDVAMPVMGGAETALRVRERWKDLPIIVTSGFDEQETLRQFPQDVDGFLQKPFTWNHLRRVLALASTPRRNA